MRTCPSISLLILQLKLQNESLTGVNSYKRCSQRCSQRLELHFSFWIPTRIHTGFACSPALSCSAVHVVLLRFLSLPAMAVDTCVDSMPISSPMKLAVNFCPGLCFSISMAAFALPLIFAESCRIFPPHTNAISHCGERELPLIPALRILNLHAGHISMFT